MEASSPKRSKKIQLKEITASLSKEELIRRLKFNAQALATIEQGAEDTSHFDELAAALVKTTILRHKDKDVRLFAATCLADILSLYAPEPPYDEDQLKDIFRVIVQQLKGLENINGPQYKRHFYILESLAIVKSFTVCLELEDSEIITDLFKLFFTVVSPNHNARVTHHMSDIMGPLIQEAESLSQDVLNIILVHLVEPRKTKFPAAYKLAHHLIDTCAFSIEPYMQIFFNNVIVLGNEVTEELKNHVYDLIFELYKINKNVLISALPQLEFKLKSNEESSRLETVKLLGKMFSHGDGTLAESNKVLWQCYLGRFLDISADVRMECVQMTQQFLLSSSETLRTDISEQLKNRCRDPDEKVRMEAVMTICDAATDNFNLIDKTLLDCVTERMRDKKSNIRCEAMSCMGKLFKKILSSNPQRKRDLSWLPSKVLHLYQNTIEDRLCIERVFHSCFVPVTLEAEDRMIRLLDVFLSLDNVALKMLEGMFRFRAKVNKDMNILLETFGDESEEENKKIIFSKIISLARSLPDSHKAQEHIKKLLDNCKDNKFYQLLKTSTNLKEECPKVIKSVTDIITKISKKSPILETVKSLLDRACPMLIDGSSFVILLRHIQKYIDGISNDSIEDDNLDEHEIVMKGKYALKLVQILAEVRPSIFESKQIYETLLVFAKHTNDSIVEITLKSLDKVIYALESIDKSLLSCYQPVLTKLVTNGTHKQSKYSVRCLYKMSKESSLATERMFKNLLDNMNFDFTMSRLRSTLAALGEVAILDPQLFELEQKTIIRDFVVKEVLMTDRETPIISSQDDVDNDDEEWGSDEDVSEHTLVKIESIKLLVKWLLGLENNYEQKATPVFRLLITLLAHDGDLKGEGKISAQNRSRLRAAAGNALLKLLQNVNYVDVITLEQYQQLGFLMQDSCVEVRDQFTQKLDKALERLRLPLDYMAYLSLVAIDPEKHRRIKVKQMITQNAQIRRDYSKNHSVAAARPYNILPEYSLPYLVHLLAHHPDLDLNDFDKLTQFKEYIWFFLEPIMGAKAENYSFLKKLLESIKQTRNKQDPDNNEVNEKMYAICDLAVLCIMKKTNSFHLKDFPGNLVLPKKLFIEDKNISNTRIYLPKDFIVSPKKTSKPTDELCKVLNLKTQATKRLKNSTEDEVNNDVSPKKKTRIMSAKNSTKSSPKKSSVNNTEVRSPVKRIVISPKKNLAVSARKRPDKKTTKASATKTLLKQSGGTTAKKISPSKRSPTKQSPRKVSPKKSVRANEPVKEKRQLRIDAVWVKAETEEKEISSEVDEEMTDEKSTRKSPLKSTQTLPAKKTQRVTRASQKKTFSPETRNGRAVSEEISSSVDSSQACAVYDEKPRKLIVHRKKQRARR